MAVQLTKGLPYSKEPKQMIKVLPLNYSNGFGLHGDAYLIIKLPHSRLLRLFARSMVLALCFVTFFVFGNLFGASMLVSLPQPPAEPETASPYSSSIDLGLLPFLSRDLANEGLLKRGDKVLLLSNDNDRNGAVYISDHILNGNYDVDLISISDFDRQSTILDGSLDFVITFSFPSAQEFIDRTLKVGGIAVVQLNDNPSLLFNKPLNYKIVYLRKFQPTVMAMRKTNYNSNANVSTQRKLHAYRNEARKAALKNLEDVLLEPPRKSSGKSRKYLKKTRYLPDLMGDSLEDYPRRVFIDVGLPEKAGGSGTGWFAKHYPTRNLDFEMYKIETVTEKSSGKEVPQVEEVIGISGWLTKNVKEEEYVVMKADVEVVEEMMESKTVRLVDELFLECSPRGNGGKGNNGGRRAYWECLSLYGRLRDEGVAVHQWWG